MPRDVRPPTFDDVAREFAKPDEAAMRAYSEGRLYGAMILAVRKARVAWASGDVTVMTEALRGRDRCGGRRRRRPHHPDRGGPAVTRPAALAVLVLLACAPPARPPVPDVAGELEAQVARVEDLAAEVRSARRIRAAENAVLLARTRRERERAARALVVARRGP